MRKTRMLTAIVGFVVSAAFAQTGYSQQAPAMTTEASAPAPSGAEAQTAHVTNGRSMVISTTSGLKRVLVSNPTVIEAVIASPTELVVSGKSAGTSSVVLWQADGQMRILDIFSDVDVSGLRDAIQQTYPDLRVHVESEQGRVQITGTVPNQGISDTLNKMAANYSKDVVNGLEIPTMMAHTQQVMLKVRFAEVDRTKLNQWGVNFLSTGAGNTVGSSTTQQFGSNTASTLTGIIPGQNKGFSTTFNLGNLLNLFLFRPDLNFGAELQDLQQKNVLQILAEPNLMAISGEPAKFLAGGEFPFPVVQGLGSGSATAVTIMFKPFGVRLEFTATVEANGIVRLKVLPEVSTLDYSNAVTISGFEIPAISTRRAETTVELKDGQSFGIAGLLDQRTTATLSQMPGFANVPILGQLFKSKNISRSDSELMVLVTPTIVDPEALGAAQPLPKPSMYKLDNEKFDQEVGEVKKTAEQK